MIKVIGKIFKWTSISIVSILLLILTLVGLALFTNPGLNAVLWGAEKALPQLKVESTKGALFPRFSLHNVQFVDESLHINTQLDKIELAINPRCLLDPQVCVDELTLRGLDFAFTELPPPSEEEPEPTEPLTSISTPLPITLNRINFEDISLDILGNKIDWQRFSTAMNMKGDVLTISPTVFDDLTVKLAEKEPSVEEDAKPGNG